MQARRIAGRGEDRGSAVVAILGICRIRNPALSQKRPWLAAKEVCVYRELRDC